MQALTTNSTFIAVPENLPISASTTLTEMKEHESRQDAVFICGKNILFIRSFINDDFTTVVHSTADNNSNSSESLYLSQERKDLGINSSHIDVLESLRVLKDGWDGDDAIAPDLKTIEEAISFVGYLQSVGERVYHVAPGPLGEIMIELRSQNGSIEFLFYSRKSKYVLFTKDNPTQGLFERSMLSNLLARLHA